jgi:hypothetical protein
LFATLNDTVTSGENKIETTAAPDRVDLLIALRTQDANGNWTCGEFTDDLESGLFVMDSVDGTGLYPPPVVSYCVKNNGRSNREAQLRLGVFDLTDTEVACTQEEPAVDVTCGPGPAGEEQPGEITKYLRVENYRGPCDADLPGPDAPGPLDGRAYTLEQLAQTPIVLTPRLGPYGGFSASRSGSSSRLMIWNELTFSHPMHSLTGLRGASAGRELSPDPAGLSAPSGCAAAGVVAPVAAVYPRSADSAGPSSTDTGVGHHVRR